VTEGQGRESTHTSLDGDAIRADQVDLLVVGGCHVVCLCVRVYVDGERLRRTSGQMALVCEKWVRSCRWQVRMGDGLSIGQSESESENERGFQGKHEKLVGYNNRCLPELLSVVVCAPASLECCN
jgi:hypothetical protein